LRPQKGGEKSREIPPLSKHNKTHSRTFDGSDNSYNLIGQFSVLLFILTFDWLMESIQIFFKLDSMFQAKLNVRAKTIQFISNLDSGEKLVKNRFVGNIGL